MTSIKRQKTSKQCSDDSILNLASLPAEIFNSITSYLTNTSCALLGVSLTAPSSSTLWRHVSSSASLRQKLSTASTFILSSIIARGGDTKLDLYNNMKDKILKKNISDEDIHALLMFINAPEKLKRLQFRLKGTNVTGTCFEPLRGSRVIEQIIAINYDRTTSQEIILPILMSIVRTDGNSLQHVQLPYIHGRRELLDNFRVEYNNLLASRDSHCKNCEGRCRNESRVPWFEAEGSQKFTCEYCLQNSCTVRYCHKCDNDLCEDCAVYWCDGCDRCSGCTGSTRKQTCESCSLESDYCASCFFNCEHCNRAGCKACLDFKECQGEGCHKKHCGDCFNDEECNVVECSETDCYAGAGFCRDCFVRDWEEGIWDCNECGMRFGKEASAIISRQRLEIESLRRENEELRSRVGSS